MVNRVIFVAILLAGILVSYDLFANDTLIYSESAIVSAKSEDFFSIRIDTPFACRGEVSVSDMTCGFAIARTRLVLDVKTQAKSNVYARLAHRQDISSNIEPNSKAYSLCKRFAAKKDVVASKPFAIKNGSFSFLLDDFNRMSARGDWILFVQNNSNSDVEIASFIIQIGYRFDATAPNCCNMCVSNNDVSPWEFIDGNGFRLFFDYFDPPFFDPVDAMRIVDAARMLTFLTNTYYGKNGLFREPKRSLNVFLTDQGGGQSRGGGRFLHIGSANVKPILAHEFGHRVERAYIGNKPAWLNEGLAVFFEKAVFQKNATGMNSPACSFRSTVSPLSFGSYRHSAFLCWAFAEASAMGMPKEPFSGAYASAFLLNYMAKKSDNAIVAVGALNYMDPQDVYASYAASMIKNSNRSRLREVFALRPSTASRDGVFSDFGFSNAEVSVLPSKSVCLIARCGTGSVFADDLDVCKNRNGIVALCIDSGIQTIKAVGDAGIYSVDAGDLFGWRVVDIDSARFDSNTKFVRCPEFEDIKCRRNRIVVLPDGGDVVLFARPEFGSLAISDFDDKPSKTFGWNKPFSINKFNVANSFFALKIFNKQGSASSLYAVGTPYLEAMVFAPRDEQNLSHTWYLFRAGMVYPLGSAMYWFDVNESAKYAKVLLEGIKNGFDSNCKINVSVLVGFDNGMWQNVGSLKSLSDVVEIPLDDNWFAKPVVIGVSVSGGNVSDRCRFDDAIGFAYSVSFF